MPKRGTDGLIYDDNGRVLGFDQNAGPAVHEAYIKAVRWEPTVEPFAPREQDKGPGGRVYQGERVGDIRNAQGKARMASPAGAQHELDLSGYEANARVRITWRNLDAPKRPRRG